MAFTNRQELIDRAVELIQNERAGRGLTDGVVTNLADSAVKWISRFAPRLVISATIDGDGSTRTFAVSTHAAGWVNGFSALKWVEHPLDQNPRAFLDESEYSLFPDPENVTHFEFTSAPASGTNNVRTAHTEPHEVDDDSSTVPDDKEPAFEFGLAALACRVYAARYGHSTQSAIDADSVDGGSLADKWLSLGKTFSDLAAGVLGVESLDAEAGKSGGGSVAGGWLEWDPIASPWGRPLLRSRRQR